MPTPPPILLISSGLSGTFTVIASQPQSNSPFHFVITGIDFETLGYTVTGNMGDIEATTSPGMERVTLTATVSINGQEAVLNGTEPLSLVSDSYPPTFNYLSACGAPGRSVSCDTVYADGGCILFLAAVPEATQTPLPTRTPTPTLVVTYELTQGSTILMSPPPGTTPLVEPLSGTFVIRVVGEDSVPPNTFFSAEIISIAFQSPRFTVTGNGYIDVTTLLLPLATYMYATVLINGEPIGLNGYGPFDTANYPPHVSVEACGGATSVVDCDAIHSGTDEGFSLTIVAVPKR